MTHRISSQSGSVLTIVLGTIAVVGVLSFSTYNLLSGPVRSAATASLKIKAHNDARIAARLVMNQSTDTDADTVTEPVDPDATGTYPTGGGIVPASVGAAGADPWGMAYGYCGWNHGAANGAVGNVLAGAAANWSSQPYIAVLSAGANRTFDTTCADVAAGSTNGEENVERYIYEAA